MMHHFPSAPALGLIQVKCAHMHPHMVYVHSRLNRASLFAEWALLTAAHNHVDVRAEKHRFSTLGTKRVREVLGAGEQTGRATVLTSPRLTED